jgi:hypothetical protein
VYPVSSSPRGLDIRQQTSARLCELPKSCYLAVDPHRYRLNVVWDEQGYPTLSPSPGRECLIPQSKCPFHARWQTAFVRSPLLLEKRYIPRRYSNPVPDSPSAFQTGKYSLPFFPLVGPSFVELVSLFAANTASSLTYSHSFNRHYGPLHFYLSLVGCGPGSLWTGAGSYR